MSTKTIQGRGVPARLAWWMTIAVMAVAAAATLSPRPSLHAAVGVLTRFVGPTSSQPLALTANGAFLVAANPDNDSVTFFDVRSDRNRPLFTVPVQDEPWGVAFHPDGSKAYVANTVSGTVSILRASLANGIVRRPHVHVPVGTEPYGLALTPNGTKLYVTNSRSDTVSVIDTATEAVIATIPVGPEPRGLAITNDGDADDNDETVYVTQFLSSLVSGKIDGQDDAKAGHVIQINTATDTVVSDVAVNPIADTGFRAAGDALARIPPGPTFDFVTGAYPNQLNGLAVKGGFVYLPSTGASPNGPVRFDVNTQSLLSVLDRAASADTNQTINMHLAVAQQTGLPKLFITQPWAIAFKNLSDQGYVISAASNIVVKVVVDPSDGSAEVQRNPLDPTRVLQIGVGKNPRGIVVNDTDTRAYVMNYVSRDVYVLNLTGAVESAFARMTSAPVPAPGTAEDAIHAGKELYNTSVGRFDPAPGTQLPIVGRMSNNGWGACAACHPFGHSDNVVWIFPAGPRRTIPQHGDFDQTDATRSRMRMLNWSANRDEQEDFELNIRAVSGGQGLIVLADGVTQDPNVADFVPLASGDRNQLKVRGVGAWDALEKFVQFGIRAPISPVSDTEPDVVAGRALFTAANCQSCHGTAQWTTSRVRYTPPPDPAQVVAGQLIGELRQVGTFDPTLFNEVRQNAAPPLGAAGFVPPSVLSIHAFRGTFFHGGIAPSLDAVMNNVTHRSAGTGGVDTLTNPADRAKIVRFLLSIDAGTVPIAQ
jgi:YVTN family beta-propeller protein